MSPSTTSAPGESSFNSLYSSSASSSPSSHPSASHAAGIVGSSSGSGVGGVTAASSPNRPHILSSSSSSTSTNNAILRAIPPPPPPPTSTSTSSFQQRLQLPTLTTTLTSAQRFGSHLHAQTPVSALNPAFASSLLDASYGAHSPAVSSVASPQSLVRPATTAAPGGAMSSYNPQEWGRGTTGGAYLPHVTASGRPRHARDLTGHEAAMPSPPPPYTRSPSSTQHASPHGSSFASQTSPLNSYSDYNTPISAATSVSSTGLSAYPSHRTTSLSQQTSPTSFPPPPGTQRERSASRTKGMFSALASRVRSTDASSPSQHSDTTIVNRNVSGSSVAGPSRPIPVSPEVNQLPPSSRRAASVGAIGSSQAPERSRAGSNENVWEPGRTLPPPPPGPPPSSRSQSLNRAAQRDSSSDIHAPIPTRVAARPSQLETVPPTPADWTDEPVQQPNAINEASQARANPPPTQGQATGLHEGARETGDPSAASARSATESERMHASSAATRDALERFSRSDYKARGSIRDRRNTSRARSKEPMTAIEPRGNPWADLAEQQQPAKPANLVLAASNSSSSLSRRPHVSKSQASPLSVSFQAPQSAEPALSSQQPPTLDRSSHAATRSGPGSAPLQQSHFSPANMSPASSPPPPQPPFSADSIGAIAAAGMAASATAIAPHRLGRGPSSTSLVEAMPSMTPSSASYQRESGAFLSSRTSLSEQGGRSDGRRTPLHETHNNTQSPFRPGSAKAYSGSGTSVEPRLDAFALASLDRFKAFISAEAEAATNRERLELFADFFVSESRIRRDRYRDAFEGMGSEVLDLTRDLWRSQNTSVKKSRESALSNDEAAGSVPPGLKTTALRPQTPREPSSAGSASGSVGAPFTPKTEPDSPGSSHSQGQNRYRSDSHRQASYQPMLSPIPSMAMSTVPDEQDSRGRAPSRWWEQSSVGPSSIADGGVRKIERSKRESKYMGVPREARAYLQWDQSAEPSPLFGNITPGPSDAFNSLGPNEYPAEKVGWNESESQTPQRRTEFLPSSMTPRTPQPQRLDMSRLITLPPPYPRHHPAVNNNHPALSAIRQTLRSMTEQNEESEMREKYAVQRPASPSAAADAGSPSLAERRRDLRRQIQDRVAAGTMSFADAAKAEADFEDGELKRARERAQKDFDVFQSVLLSPLSNACAEKITKSSASIEQLSSSLVDQARSRDPTLTQEEGDEEPELLEKLTLMKWFFEAREQLHQKLFDLQSESDDRYKQVILIPYRAANNADKIREVDAFFVKDTRDRKLAHETKVRKRFESFLAAIEAAVTRGVEDQLSAFWDIAPPLLEIVQKVPADARQLRAFDIYIPPHELDENPSYVQHPMQYLYTLLAHAQKSAYQFIEAQTNLLCLLHEVKTGVMAAGCRLMETQRYLAGEDYAAVEREMQTIRADEDVRLTSDLKERVELAEVQWKDALGRGLQDCKARLERWLANTGGWDDALVE